MYTDTTTSTWIVSCIFFPEFTVINAVIIMFSWISHSQLRKVWAAQKSRRQKVKELNHQASQSSKHAEQYSLAVSEISTWIPTKSNLFSKFRPIDGEKTKISTLILYIFNIGFFIFSYILLFIQSTQTIGSYLVLLASLSLSLTFTVIPSSILINNKYEVRIPISQATVPVICIILLIISGYEHFSITNAWEAVKGDDIQPLSVLSILFGLCYLCTTLAGTGILNGLAQKTVQSSGSSQMRFFIYIFLFAATLTIITNNEICIICLTPLVCSTAKAADIDPTPFIYMLLFASNTFGMLLITGNSANLIVSQSAGLDYIQYAKYMFLPVVLCGSALYVELYIMFGKQLRNQFQQNMGVNINKSWRDSIKLPKHAVVCAVRLFLACVGIPTVGQLKQYQQYPMDMFIVVGIATTSVIMDLVVFDLQSSNQRFVRDALWELPWTVIPFVLSLFIIVGFMDELQLVVNENTVSVLDFFATKLHQLCGSNQWLAMFLIGFIATILCQVINNQPMTVVLSKVLSKISDFRPKPKWMNGAHFALTVGANLGGNGTPIASLAVLMWKTILLEKYNIRIKYIAFSRRGLIITPLLVAICISFIAMEDMYWFKG
eukprot:519142_1